MVLCLGNSLPHVLSTSALSKALGDFASVLHPGGMVFIQNRNFDAVMAKKDRWMEPQPYREGNEEWLFQRFYDFEPDGSIRFNMITLKRPLAGEWQSTTTSTHLAPQLLQDLNHALLETGFTNVWAYGNMKGDPFDAAVSSNLVLAATRE
jgi:hypothetical protein